MNEQIRARELRQRRMQWPIILMVVGIILLVASIFILATGVGGQHGLGSSYNTIPGGFISTVPGWAVALGALSIPGIPMGVMLSLIGLVNTTKKPSLRWLRITVSILCGILLGLTVLWFLLLSALLFSGF